MSQQEAPNNQNTIVIITVIAFLLMGFVSVVALIFRPSGAIEVKFGEPGPSLKIEEPTAEKKSTSK